MERPVLYWPSLDVDPSSSYKEYSIDRCGTRFDWGTIRPSYCLPIIGTDRFLHVELPGVMKDDIFIEVKDYVVNIVANRYEGTIHRRVADSTERSGFTYREVRNLIMTFHLELSVFAVVDDVKRMFQTYENGLLILKLPCKKMTTATNSAVEENTG